MAHGRHRDPGLHADGLASLECLVGCPSCGGCARVRALEPGSFFGPRRLTCSGCGHSREVEGRTRRTGDATDPWFSLPLFLSTTCRGRTLWAWNEPHLGLLEAWISADLRERYRPDPGPMPLESGAAKRDPPAWAPARNLLLTSRLPRWMKDAKHRADVVAALSRLRAKLPVAT